MDFFDRDPGLVLDLTAIDLPVVDENVPDIRARLLLGGLRAHRAKPQAFEPFELPPAVSRKKFQRVIERAHRDVSRDLHRELCHKTNTNPLPKYHKRHGSEEIDQASLFSPLLSARAFGKRVGAET